MAIQNGNGGTHSSRIVFDLLRTRSLATLLIGALLAAAVVSWTAVALADAGLDDLNFARGLYKIEKWELAEEAFRKFVTKYPEHDQLALGMYYLGLTRFQLEQYKDARDSLRSFVKKFPKSLDVAHATFRIGECSYYLNEFETSSSEFEQALKQYPKDPFREYALAYLGDAQRRLGQFRDAATSLQRSLDEFPNGRMADEARFGLAQAFEGLGDAEKAIAAYRQVADDQTAARADAAQLGLANLLFAAGKFAEATTEYFGLEQRFPTSSLVPVAQLNGGFARYQLKEFSAALPLFDRAEKSPVQAITAGYWKGLTLKALGDFSGAAQTLDTVASRAGDDPLAESIVYQLADCQFHAGNLSAAETRFLEVVRRWPGGKLADQSLYFAAESSLQQARTATGDDLKNRLAAVELLLDKFEREYGQSGLRLAHDLQRGEFYSLRGTPSDLSSAAEMFELVLKSSTQPRTQNEARFLLARLQQRQGTAGTALATVRPLAELVAGDPQNGFPEALIFGTQLALETGEFPVAAQWATAYLRDNSGGANRADALSFLATASARMSDWKTVATATTTLLAEHPESPGVSRTIQSVAEIGYAAGQWDQASRLFQTLLEAGNGSPFYPAALSGLAWCEFKQQEFGRAAAHFKELSEKFPKHELAPEAGFQAGKSLLDGGDAEGAKAAFELAFKTFSPHDTAFLSGMQAARIRVAQARKLSADAKTPEADDRLADADRLYSEVDRTFQKVPLHAALLNEWALVLYEFSQFEKSDSVFKRLVAEHPDSEFADNARFSLAESDLINGRIEQAQTEFAALADSEKSDAFVREDSLFRLIGIGVEQAQWQPVVKWAGQLAERAPQSEYLPESRFHLANARLNLGDGAAAEEILNSLTQSAADPAIGEADWFPHVWPLLAEAQLRQKKYDDVLATADRLRQWDRESEMLPLVDEVVGRSWKNQAKFDEARAAFKRVIDSETASRTQTAAKSQLMIAETFFLQKTYDQALENYLRLHLLYKFPEWQAAALYQAGICEELLGKPENAQKTFRSVIAEFPNDPYAARAQKKIVQ